jgi:hypothetical protein
MITERSIYHSSLPAASRITLAELREATARTQRATKARGTEGPISASGSKSRTVPELKVTRTPDAVWSVDAMLSLKIVSTLPSMVRQNQSRHFSARNADIAAVCHAVDRVNGEFSYLISVTPNARTSRTK